MKTISAFLIPKLLSVGANRSREQHENQSRKICELYINLKSNGTLKSKCKNKNTRYKSNHDDDQSVLPKKYQSKKQNRPKINAAARNVLFPRCGIVSKIPRLKSLKAVTGRKSGLRCGVVASVFSLGLERECVD